MNIISDLAKLKTIIDECPWLGKISLTIAPETALYIHEELKGVYRPDLELPNTDPKFFGELFGIKLYVT